MFTCCLLGLDPALGGSLVILYRQTPILEEIVEVPPTNPCQPSPCGPNSECRSAGGSPSCSCLSGFVGSPPNCRPECVSNSDCSYNLACTNNKCKDPCPGTCGLNAECRVVSHTPNCICVAGFTGDPFRQCYPPRKCLGKPPFSNHSSRWFFLELPEETLRPCSPSPCGANAECREQNGAGACVCLQDYIGNPYEGCRPECVLNSDCPYNKACLRSKCTDPCPGTCGQNANCQVVNHLPMCTCLPGYTGDPFRFCSIPPERKRFFLGEKWR